jgi:hypothetical protein
LTACPKPVENVVPETHEVRTDAGPDPGGGYVHIARKPHVTIALAEARGISEESGVAMTEKLAAQFEECAVMLQKDGQLVDGAARVVIVAGEGGRAEGFNVKLAPGGPVAQNALRCLMPPAKLLVFPDGDGGQRGIAVEATWGPKTR